MAFNNPVQVKRMVDRLDQPNAHFYIHADKKKKDLPVYHELLKGRQNVTIVSVYDVYWGGISQVKTMLHLLKLATAATTPFKYYVFLSGQDYPIKSNTYINEFFNTHTCDFLSYNRISDLSAHFRHKYEYYHYLDSKYINPKDPNRIMPLYYLYYGFYKRIGKFLPKRSFYKNFEPYFGSDWMVLYHDTVTYILDFVDSHKDYMRYMTYVEIPSELFIHNIILNSERKTNLVGFSEYPEWQKHKKSGEVFHAEYSSLRYMDWSETGQATKPAVLDISYFDALKADKNLFCRKVDDKISAALLDKIDTELL